MKFLTLCIVLTVILAIVWASPAKNNLRDLNDSSSSSEEDEQVIMENNKNSVVEDNKEEDNDSSSSSSEEIVQKAKKRHRIIVVDDNDEIVDSNKISRTKRSLNVDPHSSNQLKVKDEGSIKYEKYLKLKSRLRRDLETGESDSGTNEINERFARSADTSEEDSSEEKKKENKHHDHHEAKHEHHETKPEHLSDPNKHEEAHAETEPKPQEESVKAEGSRRKRNLEDSSEVNQSAQDQNDNEVFIFSNEAKHASEENLKGDHFKNNEYELVSDPELEKSLVKKSSDEDYAQGCGGNREDNSNDSSDENNETTYNEQ